MNTRREFILATLAGAVSSSFVAADEPATIDHSQHPLPPGWIGNETIAMLLYPGFTTLDLFGPHHMFISMVGAKVSLVSPTLEPVVSESGIAITPTMTIDDCPEKVTVLFIPGGSLGTLAAAENKSLLDFIADRGAKADWLASVCTGSVLLGAAGLLTGYRATSHWLTRNVLSEFGAIPVNERVVIDRNRITGAGVTAGLDFSLTLVGKLRGDDFAQAVQLFSEYDPQPPYDAGTPEKAMPETLQMLTEMHVEFNQRVKAIAEKRRSRNGQVGQ